jgi:hypothetical protein
MIEVTAQALTDRVVTDFDRARALATFVLKAESRLGVGDADRQGLSLIGRIEAILAAAQRRHEIEPAEYARFYALRTLFLSSTQQRNHQPRQLTNLQRK